VSSFLLPLLPQHLRDLFERNEASGRGAPLPDETPQALPYGPAAEPSSAEPWYFLTARERQVTALVYMGHRNYEIAEILGVGYGTIQTHLQHIFDKFGLRSRKELRRLLQGWHAEAWWANHHR
jgi:DNA-binding CsgD family transcriptional regulator